MIEQFRPEPFLLADHHAIDFLNTICTPRENEIEWLGTGEGFLSWLCKTDLISEDIVALYRKTYSKAELDGVALEARNLREYFRKFIVGNAGSILAQPVLKELGRLNQILAHDHQYSQIEPSGKDAGLKSVQCRHWQNAEDLLLPLANAMAALITEADFSHIKNCEGPSCTLWFLDISKNHKRRWCSMSVCGNRAKAAAHRARRKS